MADKNEADKKVDNSATNNTVKYAKILAIVFGIIALLVAFVSQQPGGYIETQGGSTCSWRLEGDASTDRAVLFDCECPNGKKYSCKYQGRPDATCPPFWRDFFGFFREIRHAASGENHACDLDEINWSNVPLCKDYKNFTMKRIGQGSPAGCT